MTKITGYRELSAEELGLINETKALESRFNGLIDRLRAVEGLDQRQVSIGATDGEGAFMRLIRGIARPERITD